MIIPQDQSADFVAKSTVRLGFFEKVFGTDLEGHICVATTDPRSPKTTFSQRFFKWPSESIKLEEWILSVEKQYNVYFCVSLLKILDRKKSACLPSRVLWADLDEINPDIRIGSDKESEDGIGSIPPTIIVRSSPGRWQAYWRVTPRVEPFYAEDYSRRIAYFVGADKSGWDMTQLLRIPFTQNFKYRVPVAVELQHAADTTVPISVFESLPSLFGLTEITPKPVPEGDHSAEQIIYKYKSLLEHSPFFTLWHQEPDEDHDWSSVFWAMLNTCFRIGMTVEEVFVIGREAKCNKYIRDHRPIDHMWRDILKAAENYKNVTTLSPDLISMPTLASEIDLPKDDNGNPLKTFIDEYRAWGAEATDAVPDFHDLSIFVLLSAIISMSVKIETSAGDLTPNLWGMILGDSTLTRKSTCMRLAMDYVMNIDPELVVATDGTSEGILSALALRPNKASIFFKDEISGLFDSMGRKDYLAGLQETLTALYDAPAVFSRRLRKETIMIESPAFVFIGGGVTERVYNTIDEGYVLSGFLPRFLVVYGEGTVETRRALGPPTEAGLAARPKIFNKIADMYETYAGDVKTKIGGSKVMLPPRIKARLTHEAWKINADFEADLLLAGQTSLLSDLALPTFDRMSRSLLKMACILACLRQKPVDNSVEINANDMIQAAYYVSKWGQNSVNLLLNAGKGHNEKLIDKAITFIMENPGVPKSNLMRRFHLSGREAMGLIETLEERDLVKTEKRGKGQALWVVQ